MLFIIAVVASGLQDKAQDGPRLTTCRQGRECSQANASPEPRAGSIP